MYKDLSKTLKTIGDKNRLEIIDLLSCGELCACDLLEHFSFSQPTLSHHMKALVAEEIVTDKKEGTKTIYTLNRQKLDDTFLLLNQLTHNQSPCICDHISEGECSS